MRSNYEFCTWKQKKTWKEGVKASTTIKTKTYIIWSKTHLGKKKRSFRQMGYMSNLEHSDISDQSGCKRCAEQQSRRRKGNGTWTQPSIRAKCLIWKLFNVVSGCQVIGANKQMSKKYKKTFSQDRGKIGLGEFHTISFWARIETRWQNHQIPFLFNTVNTLLLHFLKKYLITRTECTHTRTQPRNSLWQMRKNHFNVKGQRRWSILLKGILGIGVFVCVVLNVFYWCL